MAGTRIRAVSDGRYARKSKRPQDACLACLQVWPQVCSAVVIKRTAKKRVVEITRKMVEANAGTSTGLAFSFSWRNRAQYRHSPPLERDHAKAPRQLDAQVSACGQALGGSGKRHVAAFAVRTTSAGQCEPFFRNERKFGDGR